MNDRVHLDRSVGRPLAVVRRMASPEELSRVVQDGCGLVWDVVRSRQIPGAGRHVAIYLDDRITVEVGVELDAPFGGFGEVIDSTTPSGLVAATTHRGPYARLGEAHDAIRRWCQDNGHPLAGPRWEVYGHWEEEWNEDPSKITVDVFYLLGSPIGRRSIDLSDSSTIEIRAGGCRSARSHPGDTRSASCKAIGGHR